MAKIYTSVSQLIGGTPLLELTHLEKGLGARVLAKLESRNPAGSAKDRVALAMIDEAERQGLLKPGSVIIEPTSGNTGIGLCSVGTSRGYRCIIVMPDTMSMERRLLMKAYGAELVLTPGKLGMSGAIAKAEELAKTYPDSFVAGQFVNPANPKAHYETTGPEIWQDTDGQVDLFVAGVGTGGTITGTGRYLKERNPAIRVVGVEPADSPVLTQGRSGPHGIQGIGAGFVPEILDRSVLDDVKTVTTQQAYEAGRRLGREQYVIPYLMSGFPGCTDEDMRALAQWLARRHWSPQQTQCFIPTPGSIATAMYYCGRNEDGEEIYVARSDADRLRQHRILMPDFGRMPERGGHADAEDAGEGHHREPRRENTTERWRDERRSADGLAPRNEGRRDFREDRKPPFPRFDDERESAPRRDFRHPDRDGFRKPGFRQDADKPFRPRPFPDAAHDGDEAPQARPSFRRDGQGERPFRPRGDRFVDRDGEEARRPFRPRRDDDDGRPFRKDGFRPRRFNDRDGNEGQDGQKRRAPFPRFDDEREGAPRRDFRRPERDGFGKPGFRQDADKPFRKNSFRRDGKPAFGSRRRDRGFDGPALNDDEE